MTRKKVNPAQSLSRFMHGVCASYTDRGMPINRAKVRMVDHTLEECVKLMKSEEDVPDEMLVIMAQWMSRALNNRGSTMTKEIKKIEENVNEDPQLINDLLQPLRDIKAVKDAIDTFIETYKGWSELDGKETS